LRVSATPSERFFAFLSQQDPFNVKYQIANCAALMKIGSLQPLTVTPNEPIKGHHQILVNNLQTADAHGSTLLPQFSDVWKYSITVKTK
jgi:hypothetical protein